MARRWYVLRTKSQCERLAADALEREGIEPYLPRARSLQPSGRYTTTPMFPGYLFIRTDLETYDGPSVRQLPGILGWVRFDGVVPAVPDEVVDGLIRRVNAINQDGGLWNRFRVGEKVRVLSGPMEGLAEIVEEPQSPEARVRVLLEFMGRLVSAQVPLYHLRRVGQESVTSVRTGLRRTRGGGRWTRGFGPRAVATG